MKLRADRLGVDGDGLLLWAENDLSAGAGRSSTTIKPRALVVDSIQTVFLPELESAPGSVAQVRECGARLLTLAKGRGIATFLVGHVTKDGALAGPRVLEHLVDTVLYFEGEQHHAYRVLRAVKNRFGSTNEIGVFQMGERRPRSRSRTPRASSWPSGRRTRRARSSSPSLEGTRPLLLELQALVAPASFGTPRRTVLGADYNRVCLLLAVLEKRAGVPARQPGRLRQRRGRRARRRAGRRPRHRDRGGVELHGAARCRGDVLVVGEVGLTGEVRAVSGRRGAPAGGGAARVPAGGRAARATCRAADAAAGGPRASATRERRARRAARLMARRRSAACSWSPSRATAGAAAGACRSACGRSPVPRSARGRRCRRRRARDARPARRRFGRCCGPPAAPSPGCWPGSRSGLALAPFAGGAAPGRARRRRAARRLGRRRGGRSRASPS